MNDASMLRQGMVDGPSNSKAGGLGAPAAHLLAWSALLIVNAIAIAVLLPAPRADVGLRIRHHLLDAGQMLAAGLLVSSACEAWGRWGPRRAFFGYLAAFVAVGAVSAATLLDDLAGLGAKLPGPDALWSAVFVAVAGASIPIAALAGRFAGRRRPTMAIALLVGLCAAAVNHGMLLNDYPGVHLFIAWGSATILGGALTDVGATWGWLARLRAPGRAWLVHTGRFLLAAAAAATLVGRTSNQLTVELLRTPGAVLAPYVAALRGSFSGSESATLAYRSWITPRDAGATIAPTSPPILPSNGIVIVFVVDCMRADLLVDPRRGADLPAMFALRDASVHFTQARATASATTVSVTSLFTSRYYSQLYWLPGPGKGDRVYAHKDDSARVPELLARANITSAVATSLGGLATKYGIARGFSIEHIPKKVGTPVETVLSNLTTVLRKVGDAPHFIYVHVDDAHSPYNKAGTEGSPFDRYVRELALVDRAIGRLDRELEALGLADRTALILTADHGEAFGEHNDSDHGHTLYDELLRVPLLVRVPGVTPRRVSALASLIDLGPTILDLFGQPTPGTFMGRSLLPYLRGDDSQEQQPVAADSPRWLRAVVFPDGFKVIHDRRRGLWEKYNLVTDPGETTNLISEDGDDPHAAVLTAFFKANELKRPNYKVPYRR